MSYDPAWDMPQINWKQQGAYEQGSIPPVIEPDAGTQVYLGPVAREWLPWICGALDVLRNPSNWIVADDNAMFNTLRRIDTLLGLVCGNGGSGNPIMIRFDNCTLQTSTDGGVTWVPVPGWDDRFCTCVNECAIPAPPLLPPGSPPSERACNIAGYLANVVIHTAITQAINAYDHDLSLLALAGNIAALTFAFDLPWTAAFIYGVYDLYAFFTAGNIADLRTAEADPVFWEDVTCAIFSAIHSDGMVTDGNCAALIANICGLTYTPAIAVTAVCSYVTQLGCGGLRSAQIAGALAVYDCTSCGGTWCYEFDFTLSDGGWTNFYGGGIYGAYTAGVGWSATVSAGFTAVVIKRSMIASVITDFDVSFQESGGGTGPHVVDIFSGGSAVYSTGVTGSPNVSCAYHLQTIPSVTGDELVCSLQLNTVGPTINICKIRIEGTGTNPFGLDNCTS